MRRQKSAFFRCLRPTKGSVIGKTVGEGFHPPGFAPDSDAASLTAIGAGTADNDNHPDHGAGTTDCDPWQRLRAAPATESETVAVPPVLDHKTVVTLW